MHVEIYMCIDVVLNASHIDLSSGFTRCICVDRRFGVRLVEIELEICKHDHTYHVRSEQHAYSLHPKKRIYDNKFRQMYIQIHCTKMYHIQY